MIVTTTGFYGTGSSAITDLLREYDSVSCKDDYEIRFLYDPDGVSDLEYNLIENPNRHNSSHSLKRFMRNMDRLDHIWFVNRYNKYFNGDFLPIIKKYISSITELEYNSTWHYDVYDKGNFYYILTRTYSKLCSMSHKVFHTKMNGRALFSKNEKAYLTTVDEDVFLKATREMVSSVANILNDKNCPIIMFDQLVPPSNIQRYNRYVENLKILIVDRDPRDIYLLEKEVWHGTIVPVDDVVNFCKWFKWTRETAKNSDTDNVLRVQFEDLIFNYDISIRRIENFLGLSPKSHSKKMQYFVPKRSAINTQLWRSYTQYDKEMEYIRKSLPEFCYLFPVSNIEYDVNTNEIF